MNSTPSRKSLREGGQKSGVGMWSASIPCASHTSFVTGVATKLGSSSNGLFKVKTPPTPSFINVTWSLFSIKGRAPRMMLYSSYLVHHELPVLRLYPKDT
eukprot:TRINITY_DN2474_c0_g1_i1.p1 TRINITY_DN2474_c0_g1~~TRINITY_DN2474_c0_g1_i1.p1  ORF type:complete len:100 (-),score=10.50 TRINITY_DN2474_c0_g1_i1:274-573(-)